MKKFKCSFWVKQLRRPLCALVVVAIVLSYGFLAHAEGEAQTFLTRFGLSSASDIPVLSTVAMYNSYANSGNDASKLYCTTNYRKFEYSPNYFQTVSSWESNRVNSLNGFTYPTTYEQDGVTYDFSNPYSFFCYDANNSFTYSLVISESKVYIVDCYFVSASPMYIYSNLLASNKRVRLINTVSGNGLYTASVTVNSGTSTQATIWFTDCDVLFRSQDGSSGYTTFSTSSVGDFDISNADSYFNFNVLKTGDYIVSPADPEENTYNSDGEHYNYGTVNHKVFGKPFDSLYYGSTVGINSYMRENSNKFWLFTDAKIGIKFAGEANVSEYEQNDSLSISSFIRNNSSTYSQILDPGLMIGPGGSLSAKLRSGYHNIAGSDFGYTEGIWSDGSFVFPDDSGFGSYYQYTYKPLKGNLIGDSNNKLEVAYLDLTSWFSYDGTNDDIMNIDTNSGYYHVRFNLLDGSYNVIQNDISQNLNPIEGENNLPISGIGGGSSGGTGNINITQGGISNNLNAIIEYLFQLDASGMQNVSQNVGSTIQYVVSNIGDTSNTTNGFWDVLKKGYSVIPDDIWNWIKLSVATLLSGAVITWVYNGVRVKRG